MMKRREFITALGGAAAAWPIAASAQQPTMPVIGFLASGSPPLERRSDHNLAAFRTGVEEAGFVEGKDVIIDYKWARGQFDRLPTLASELVARPVDVIFAFGTPIPARAAKAATSTIPIVFAYGGDPVADGLVASLNRPGGNVTGATFITAALAAKRLELLRELVPNADTVGVLVNPKNQLADTQLKDVDAASRSLGQPMHIAYASSENEFEAAFTALARQGVRALLLGTDTIFFNRRDQLIALAASHRIPAIYTFREYVRDGGLISYGPIQTETIRQAGLYAGRILKGAKPADLPVLQPTKFELVINLKTATALGLEVPWFLQQRADEVIE
jgi:putative tryptophan/tyrosine transport system substrate-binding protein